MRRLITHLAQFSAFSRQGEVLCTRGLQYLLESAPASEELVAYLSSERVKLDKKLFWRAEVLQQDRGRPDLEGCTVDGRPAAKVEAKLGAPLSAAQLLSYAQDLEARGGTGVLLILVPRYRVDEAKLLATEVSVPATVVVTVSSWDDILACLSTVTTEPFASELAQFTAMYRVLSGDDVEPMPDDAALRAWREREDVFITFVDRATRELARGESILPMALDARPQPPPLDSERQSDDEEPAGHAPVVASKVPRRGYLRRYTCRALHEGPRSCFSVGVRDPFPGYDTPVWVRFHRDTPAFHAIRTRLRASSMSDRAVEADGHMWMALSVPLEADVSSVVTSLVGQADDIWRVVGRGAVPERRASGDGNNGAG